MPEPIPFLDLETQYKKIKPEIMAAVEDVFGSRAFIQGKYVRRFEEEFSQAIGVGGGIGCSSGTSALVLALAALGVKEGDEVITTPHTFFATGEAISILGARPVFVDIVSTDYTIDPCHIESAITGRTVAIAPVHIYGAPCDMTPILEIAQKYDLAVIEDCAQAHLASYKGSMVGSLGDISAFSFYPGKNLGAYGDAGLVATSNEEVAGVIRKLLDHGRQSKYEHEMVGYNYRMDGVQAAILSVKLKYLKDWNRARRIAASLYNERLCPRGFKVAEHLSECEPVYHLYVVEVSNRYDVIKSLTSQGIDVGVHYPVPLHLQPALKHLGYRPGDFPNAECAANRVVSLPMCPEITEAQIDRVCGTFLEVARP